MNIEKIINKLDYLYPNTYEYEDKKHWIEELEKRIENEILNTHEGKEEKENSLYADSPYSEIYIYYLQAQIDNHNGEYDRYNNHITLFNEMYADYESWYHRNHMPVSRGKVRT